MTNKLLLALFASLIASGTFAQEWICSPERGEGMPIFAKTFKAEKRIKAATIHTSALGVYTLSVNGKEIGDEELKPGWTDYRKEIFYQSHSLPSSLLKGDTLNITAQVSNGWWIGGITRGVYGKDNRHAFICWVDVEYKDGTKEKFVTDSSWKCATDGALRMGDIYNGETYDATRHVSTWHNVVINKDKKGKLIPEFGPKVRIRDKAMWRNPQKVTLYEGTKPTNTDYGEINVVKTLSSFSSPFTLKKGHTLLIDFGQNMVGWINFAVKGQKGTELTCTFGEMLNYNGDAHRLDKGPAGSLWTYNLREAKATLRYTLQGGKVETYHPRHTFFGFRYAEMTATEDVEIRKVVGQVVGSDITEWGTFECSNKDINQLYCNVWWGQRGNFLSIPTDCPQRDERLGWTGDTQIFSTTALYNSDTKEFYRKWMRDMRNSQREDGAYCCTAPAANMWGFGGAAWGDAGIIVPWNVYVMTGDKTIIEENYESMEGWMRHCASFSEGEWLHVGAATEFGDWLAYKEVDKRYVSYAYYYYSSTLMAKMADILGREADANRYRSLAKDVKAEYQRRYITDGEINTGKDTQTSYLLALHFNLLEESQRSSAMKSLRKNIEENGYKLSTGFVGTGILMETLTECGMTDLAYRLLLQRENPSWLYSIDQGATTIWERWDSYTLADGFNKHEWNMNSFNHYSYGAVAGWFYSTILGIRPAEPGFQSILLTPHFGGEMTWAKGGTNTPQGRVDVEWKLSRNNSYEYAVTIPRSVKTTLLYEDKTPITFIGDGKKHTFKLQ
ncbi:MAG: family 78 glycoside hydrolase catalytic domain [Prevotella sp.]|nr:family 78 glycoside hydrolase catalytic domain [Candidatus Prevotella equi]